MNSSLFQYIFGLSKNPYVAKTALFLSYHLVFGVVAFLVYWSLFLAPRKIYAFALLFSAGLGTSIVVSLMKIIFLAERPYIKMNGIVPLVQAWGTSFPSWHAAFMASLAVAGYVLNKELGIALIIIAILTGISRVAIGVHYPFDVMAGWLTGFLVGLLFINLFKKI
ncbi:MAG: phosphatase PAP2 family protein [bacterium]|nr:phosphatase PAP2 family protein [bacterium]